jgi:hypothetical protein
MTFGQATFTIKGQVTCVTENIGIPDVKLWFVSPKGDYHETYSDITGYYKFLHLSVDTGQYIINADRIEFFNSKKRIIFKTLPCDTIVNMQLTYLIVEYYPNFDIHFNKNTNRPEKHFKDTLQSMIRCLKDNPHFKMKVMGCKDSSESYDLREERATLVYNELIAEGIPPDRLKIDVSNKPASLVTNDMDCKTGQRKSIILTEKYILSLPVKQQAGLRQLNQCVTFQAYEY